jgi:hypothetical protein
MKIAILTQPLHNNYGGNLQNFALQKALKKLNHDPLTIDIHRPVKLKTRLKLGYFKRLVLYIFAGQPRPSFKNYSSDKKKELYVRENIISFINAEIIKTPRIYKRSKVLGFFKKVTFDAVIVGSDQVWRPAYSPDIYLYYLDFLEGNSKIKKIAYAPSFGTDEWEYTEKESARCKELIKEFDLVTVREKNAKEILKEKLDINATSVLDPTFLLSEEEYKEVLENKRLTKRRGIYTYILDGCDWKNKVVETVKDELKLPTFSNHVDGERAREQKIPSIEGWIKGFIDAEFVITDSFHGTVFSIIFNKPFISLVNINRGASRFESILEELELKERLMYRFCDRETIKLANTSICYDIVNERLSELRFKSIDLLKKHLN